MHRQAIPIQRHAALAPPSYKPADMTKTQLHRRYTSMLRSSPLMLLFQHNNLRAHEWVAIRRELASALRKVSAQTTTPGMPDPADSIRITAIRTGIFGAALRVVEFYKPELAATSSADGQAMTAASEDHMQAHQHGNSLSKEAYLATLHRNNSRLKNPNKDWKYDPNPQAHLKRHTPLHKLLHGPIAVLSFPEVTPQHLAAALSILAPTPGASSAFPAPRRKAVPSYYDDAVQLGLQKLLLLGARVEGKTLDSDRVRWVGGLAKSGGIDGLRAQLVNLLQSVGGGITNALQAGSSSLWLTMESRRAQMEEAEKPKMEQNADVEGEKKDVSAS